ncbi:MAG: FIST C-terminal domain-containing protein [Telmatospirillum sp.]|nr:FIST C-terminal domain-containing protein [Telmatospirillum sp.]
MSTPHPRTASPRIASAEAHGASAAAWGRMAVSVGEALSRDLPGARLGILYATESMAGKLEEALAVVRRVSGIPDWVGAVGHGIVGHREYFNSAALTALAIDLPSDAYRVLPHLTDDLSPLGAHAGWIAAHRPGFGIVHADPRGPDPADLIAGIADASDAFLVGGLTAAVEETSQIAGRAVASGVSGVLFAGSVAVATGITQGCMPSGPVHRITAADGNVVIGLDGERALDVFKRDLDIESAAQLRGYAAEMQIALPIPGSDMGDYLVRDFTGIDPSEGLIGVAALVEPGDRLFFARRDRAAAVDDMARMCEGLKRRAPRATGGLYFSCIARGPRLFGTDGYERGLLRETFGALPVAGFFCNGEISNARLYGYTGVLALFS